MLEKGFDHPTAVSVSRSWQQLAREEGDLPTPRPDESVALLRRKIDSPPSLSNETVLVWTRQQTKRVVVFCV